jgi:hypothetical protein
MPIKLLLISISISVIVLLPVYVFSADWKPYGESDLIKYYMDQENIVDINNNGTLYKVWTQWELTKKGKIETLPKKYQKTGETIRIHWQVNCEDRTMIELSNRLYDKKGNLLIQNDNVGEANDMVPGTWSEIFLKLVCLKNSTFDKGSSGEANNVFNAQKEGIQWFREEFETRGLNGVSSFALECYDKAEVSKNRSLMVRCISMDISGMIMSRNVAEVMIKMGSSNYTGNEFFIESNVRERIKRNLPKIGHSIEDDKLQEWFDRVEELGGQQLAAPRIK